MLAPETVLQGRYRILRQLGQGGMGAVYEALDSRLDTTVALKETLFADERLRRQFEREARLLARMHHPALPRVSDHFSEGEGQFLVMQYIAGDDLEAMMTQKRGPFPAGQVLTWADQLLDALDYLHTQEPQIVHRDIKPQNLKLTARGQIILLDFGLAKGQAGSISQAPTASIFGYTPNYAPLEQIQGSGTDARSDLYALAATLYHLMTGVKPPDALTRAAAVVNSQPDPLRPASEANPAVAPEVNVVLQKALAQNKDQRYESAAEMRRALHGTDQASTVINRGEAKTVLFPPSVGPVPAETQAIKRQETVSAGETTVVRQRSVAKKRLLPWVLSGAAVLVLAACAWGFIALQRRNNSAIGVSPNAAGVKESPATAVPTGTTPSGSQGEKPATAEGQSATSDQVAAKKNEKAAPAKQKKQTPAKSSQADEGHGEGHSADHTPTAPELPRIPDVKTRGRGRAGRIEAGGTVIRNFPDGRQLITTPDGTRILVTPDGGRQVLRPGQPPIRRRVPPAP